MGIQEMYQAFNQEDHQRVLELVWGFIQRTNTSAMEVMRACRLGHRSAVILADGPTAQRLADRMLALAAGNLIWKAEAHYRKGVAEWWCGDAAAALEHYRQYLMRAPCLPQEFAYYVGPVHYNMGLAYRAQQNHTKALSHLKEALHYFEPGQDYWWQTKLDIIWTHMRRSDYALAGQLLDDCTTLQEGKNEWLRWDFLTLQAIYLLRTGCHAQAQQLAQSLMQEASDHHRGLCACIQGEIAMRTGDQATAQAALSVALCMAEQTKDPAIIDEVFRLNRLMQGPSHEAGSDTKPKGTYLSGLLSC